MPICVQRQVLQCGSQWSFQLRILDNFVGMPSVVLRQVAMVLTVRKPVEFPQLQILTRSKYSCINCVSNCDSADHPLLQFNDKVADILVVTQDRSLKVLTSRRRQRLHSCSSTRQEVDVLVVQVVLVPFESLAILHLSARWHRAEMLEVVEIRTASARRIRTTLLRHCTRLSRLHESLAGAGRESDSLVSTFADRQESR